MPFVTLNEKCVLNGNEFAKEASEHFELTLKLLQCDDLSAFNWTLAAGVPDDVLDSVIRKLYFECMSATADYVRLAPKGRGEFIRSDGLPVLVLKNNPAMQILQKCYDKTSILLGYADAAQRNTLTAARMTIAAVCQMVYDESIWSH